MLKKKPKKPTRIILALKVENKNMQSLSFIDP